jgi:hypothetical protein
MAGFCENSNESSCPVQGGKYHHKLSNFSFAKRPTNAQGSSGLVILSDNRRSSIPAARDPCVTSSPSGLRFYEKRADNKWQPDSRRKKL